jgi:hypothetical protein
MWTARLYNYYKDWKKAAFALNTKTGEKSRPDEDLGLKNFL